MNVIEKGLIWVNCSAKLREDGTYRFTHWAFYHNKLFRVAYKKDDKELQDIKVGLEKSTLLLKNNGRSSFPVPCEYIVKEYVDHIALAQNTLILTKKVELE